MSLTKLSQFYICKITIQFGGKNKRKFMISQMKELFLSFQNTQMSAQQNILDETIENWMAEGQEKQIDDILVLGVKI